MLYNKTGHHYEVAQEKEAILGVATRGQTIECLQQKMNRNLRIKITGCSDIFETWTINNQTHTKSVISRNEHNLLFSKMMFTINILHAGHPVVTVRAMTALRAAWLLISAVVVLCPKNGRHSSVSFPAATQSPPLRAANTWLDLQFW